MKLFNYTQKTTYMAVASILFSGLYGCNAGAGAHQNSTPNNLASTVQNTASSPIKAQTASFPNECIEKESASTEMKQMPDYCRQRDSTQNNKSIEKGLPNNGISSLYELQKYVSRDDLTLYRYPIERVDGNISDISVSPNDKYLTIITADNLFVYTLPTGRVQMLLDPIVTRNEEDNFTSVAFSLDSNYIVAGTDEGRIVYYNADGGKLAKGKLRMNSNSLNLGDEIIDIAIHHSQNILYVLKSNNEVCKVYANPHKEDLHIDLRKKWCKMLPGNDKYDTYKLNNIGVSIAEDPDRAVYKFNSIAISPDGKSLFGAADRNFNSPGHVIKFGLNKDGDFKSSATEEIVYKGGYDTSSYTIYEGFYHQLYTLATSAAIPNGFYSMIDEPVPGILVRDLSDHTYKTTNQVNVISADCHFNDCANPNYISSTEGRLAVSSDGNKYFFANINDNKVYL